MAEELTPAQNAALDEYKDKKTKDAEDKAGAPTPTRPVSTKKMARGGGIESRGKTKGRFV
jgi:hypothetical protein